MASTIDLTMNGPSTSNVGQDVTFDLTITNRGSTAATGLKITDQYDTGFQHASGEPLGPPVG